MPIIHFSTADVLRSKILDAGYHSFRISTVTGPVKDSAGTGWNYKVVHELIDATPEELNGKVIEHNVSSKALGMAIPMITGCTGVKPDDLKDKDIDLDILVNTKVDCKIIQDQYQGRLKNEIEGWFPYKSVVGKAPTF